MTIHNLKQVELEINYNNYKSIPTSHKTNIESELAKKIIGPNFKFEGIQKGHIAKKENRIVLSFKGQPTLSAVIDNDGYIVLTYPTIDQFKRSKRIDITVPNTKVTIVDGKVQVLVNSRLEKKSIRGGWQEVKKYGTNEDRDRVVSHIIKGCGLIIRIKEETVNGDENQSSTYKGKAIKKCENPYNKIFVTNDKISFVRVQYIL